MIKFLDLKKINEPYHLAFQEKFAAILDSGWYVLGNQVQEFEKNFATYCGVPFCVSVGNGFDALVLIFEAYIALGKLKKGDAVLVPAHTYIASVLAIKQAGLVPILVEPNMHTFTIDPVDLQNKISASTKAILVVHLYGRLVDMDRIRAIAKANNLLIIEDAAQSHGVLSATEMQFNKNTTVAAYSFYPGKNLGALGDGGAVVTTDAELADCIKALRNYGSQTKYIHDLAGINSRLDEVQAAFLNVKLPYLDESNSSRRAIAKRYLAEIKNPKIILPEGVDKMGNLPSHVYHLFVVRTADRVGFQSYLQQNGIETVIHYPVAVHHQKALSEFRELSLPITEKLAQEVLSLPISPVLTDAEISEIIAVVNRY